MIDTGAHQGIMQGLAPQAAPRGAEMMQLMNLLRQAFGTGSGQQMSAGLNSFIPPPAPGAMPGTPQMLRGTAPRSPWPSGGTFGGLR